MSDRTVGSAPSGPATGSPLFSIVVPVYAPPLDVLGDMIESVLAQRCADWELVLVDDNSPDQAVRDVLRRYAARDARIHVIERPTNGHIVRASNDGIDAVRGEFIVLLDHDDLLTPDALAANARAIAADDEVDYLYSDEDKVDARGRFFKPFRKPDWSPELLRSMNYCSHLSVLRTSLVREVGAFRDGFDGSQDHDLVLRVTEKARRVVHIPRVLYHWRAIPGSAAADPDAKPYAWEAGRRAVQEHLDRLGLDATAVTIGSSRYAVERRLPAERRVSIVIPTRGSSGRIWGRSRVMVVEAVRSALALTHHQDVEVVVVVDEPTPASVIEELTQVVGDRLVVVRFNERFNYSRKVNFGVLASSGDRIVILNDDTEVRTENWLEELLGPLEEPGVGVTGAKLFYSSNTIQHAGLAFLRGHYVHPFKGFSSHELGPWGELMAGREVSGVTGACVGVRRDVFFEVGGMAEELPENFNDVDFAYKIRAADYRIVFVPRCELFHFETMTRIGKVQKQEHDFMLARWGHPTRDPYLPDFPDMPLSWDEQVELKRRENRRRKALLA